MSREGDEEEMGHQIYAVGGGDRGVFFSAGAWQVIHWCETFTPPVKPDGMSDFEWFERNAGGSYASAESVAIADANVPMAFDEARAAGLIDNGIDCEMFDQCRSFLHETARAGLSIRGSF